MSEIAITTASGTCPSYVYRPSGSGPWPAVLVFMDGLGIRPAMLEVGERLSTCGYFVLLPDLFYRAGRYEPMDPRAVFTDPEKLKALREKFFAHVTQANIMSDTRAFLDYLAAQPDVKAGPIGTTGYCMGGLMSLTAAGTFPDRIAATASYHGGRLATDAPESPHLLAPKIRSRVYIAGATEDASFPDEMKARLEDALTRAGVDHRIETYPAKHGWSSATPRFTTKPPASGTGRRSSRCSMRSSKAPASCREMGHAKTRHGRFRNCMSQVIAGRIVPVLLMRPVLVSQVCPTM